MSLISDITAPIARDPAAANIIEVVLAYPGVHAVVLHRLAHALYLRRVPVLPRLVSHFSRWLTGIEIHPGAKIGERLFVDHGMGVVIGETAEVGNDVTIYQGVTLGGTGKERGKRHPTLGNNIVVGVGAKVLGAIVIGDNVRIGAGAVVLRDVPTNATAVGIPAKVVVYRDPVSGEARRVENMPDPEAEMLNCLHRKVMEMDARLLDLEQERGSDVVASLDESDFETVLARAGKLSRRRGNQ